MREWLTLLPLYAPKNPRGLVFPSPTGCRANRRRRAVRSACPSSEAGPGVRATRVHYILPEWLRLAGVKRRLRWHDLRHTCASSLVSGFWGPKWSLDEVRDHMGHSSVTVTEIYAHLDRDVEARARPPNDLSGYVLGLFTPRPRPLKTVTFSNDYAWSRGSDLNRRPPLYESHVISCKNAPLGGVFTPAKPH
jgi:hypothetical protein